MPVCEWRDKVTSVMGTCWEGVLGGGGGGGGCGSVVDRQETDLQS